MQTLCNWQIYDLITAHKLVIREGWKYILQFKWPLVKLCK